LATIADIINQPTTGLIPYLTARLAVNWNRYQLRDWAFIDTDDNTSGFRLREGTTQQETWDKYIVTWTITLGKVISIDDPTLSQVLGGQLREEIDQAIIHWASGVRRDLIGGVTRITGMNDIEQNRRVSSENPGAWDIFVVREFEFSYYLDYQAC
jgi:hypothetical protein